MLQEYKQHYEGVLAKLPDENVQASVSRKKKVETDS